MTSSHIHAAPSAIQIALKRFSISVETLFECRMNRVDFAIRSAAAALAFGLLHAAGVYWASAPWPVTVALGILFAGAAFWSTLQIVRRFHDLGRSGGLFWALSVPFWSLWKMISLFPSLWWLWTLLCAWPIKLTLELFFKPGDNSPNGYEARETKN